MAVITSANDHNGDAAPPAVDLRLNSQQHKAIANSIICIILPAIFVGLRFLSRRICRVKFGWDDYFCVISLVLSWGVPILLIISIYYGMGKHISELGPEQPKRIFFVIYWLEIIYVLAYEAIYLTILALYIKLFPHTWLRNAAYAVGIFVTFDNIGNIFVLVFQCTPIRFYWDKTVKGGHCINDRLAYFIASLILIVTIIVALLLPVPLLWKLKISSGKRWQLLAAFSVGLFVAITSIYRLVAILRISNEDPTFTFLETGTWSALEIGAGVVATCLSSMTPLIYWVVAAFKSSSSSNSPTTLHGRYDNYGNPISHGPLRSSQFNRIPPGNDTKQPSSGNDTMVEMSGNISRDRIDGEEEDDRKRLVEDHLDKRTTPGDKVRVTTSVNVSIRPLGKDQVAAPVAPAVLGG